jgi:hypothetical protein
MAYAPYIGVIGASEASAGEAQLAEQVGDALARAGAVMICGGRGGVMAAASKGAARAGGTIVGLLPGEHRADGNEWLSIALPTGLGELRNGLLVRCSDALIAIGGSWGTLSEIALAARRGRPVFGLQTWTPQPPGLAEGIVAMSDPGSAVRAALAATMGARQGT